jgi:hypothetical protein
MPGGLINGLSSAQNSINRIKDLFRSSKGNTTPNVQFGGAADYRAKLLVPKDYILEKLTRGGTNKVLENAGGIIFPYTPTISYESFANYASQSIMHSNYQHYSYKQSGVSPIKITAKYTVQSDEDALIYLATLHLLKSLTKMQFGTDANAGAPPPVCRFSAYGDFMMRDVPVAVNAFSHDMSPDVDSYTTNSKNDNASEYYGTNFVPTVSTFSLTLTPMYSRNEQLAFNVTDFRDTPGLRKKGYL